MSTPLAHDPAGLPDPALLRLFELLHATASVTRAAERLQLAQPTVSIWLGRLRQHFGDPLFVRTPQGMLPTPRADALLPVVRDALQALQRLAEPPPPFDPATASRHWRVAMTDAGHITLLPRLLAHVRALSPAATLEATRIGDLSAAALQSGEVDLAIGLVPWEAPGVLHQTLYPQDWVCLVHPRHPRIGASLTLRSYREEAHIGIVAGTGAALMDNAMARHKVQRKLVLELPGYLGLAAIVSTTDLIATLPRHIGETLARSAGLRVLNCPVPVPPFDVKQHWHARYDDDPASRWLRGVVAELFMLRAVSRARDPVTRPLRNHG